MQTKTRVPIAFFIFNRPEETARVFAAIREARPEILLVTADGPRGDMDVPLCKAARDVVLKGVDWPCDVRTNFSDTNMGCANRMVSGINWVFEQTERAILLEDDCVPHPTFFPYCEELLERYKDDPRVMNIAGYSIQEHNPRFKIKESYYFSLIPESWGWATWRRAWKLYDRDMKRWPAVRGSGALISVFGHPGGYERFAQRWGQYYNKELPTSWDGQWAFACISNGGLSASPTVNLITNIGYTERATHRNYNTEWADLPAHAMQFPLIHPKEIAPNRGADAFAYRYAYNVDRKLRYRLVRPLKTHFPVFYQKLKKLFN